MSPLGLVMTTMGALGGSAMLGSNPPQPQRPVCFWECVHPVDGTSVLQPVALGSISYGDSNSMWDHADADLNYMPQESATHAEECWWTPTKVPSGAVTPRYATCG